MIRRRFLLPVVLALTVAACSPSGEDGSGAQPRGTRRSGVEAALVVYPRSAVPPSAAGLRKSIVSLQHAGETEDLLERYPAFLKRLEETWGPRSVRLPSHVYDYCVALRAGERREDGLAIVEKALARWPASLRHRLLDATLRMEISSRRGTLIAGTEEAVSHLLHRSNESLLAEVGVRLADLHIQWASVLFGQGLYERCLRQVDAALEIDPDSADAGRLKARVLVTLRRSDEALPLLEKFSADDDPVEMAVLRSTAFLETGDAAKAWEIVERTLASRDAAAETATLVQLRTTGGTALNRLGRFSEARAVLVEGLLARPEDRAGLHQIAAALRHLGLESASGAAVERAGELTRYYHHRNQSVKNSRRGASAAASYHEGRAWLELDRAGDALAAFRRTAGPRTEALRLLLFRMETLLRVGRLALAMRESVLAAERNASPVIGAVQSRLLCRAGRKDEARRLLVHLEGRIPEDAEGAALFRAYAMRTQVELGGADAVRERLEDNGERALSESENPVAREITRLCRAVALFEAGRTSEAAALLRQEIEHLEGGSSWAGALERLLDLASDQDSRPEDDGGRQLGDLSDLVDHPWLALRSRSLPQIRASSNGPALVEAALSVIRRRNGILGRMGDLPDNEILHLWAELIHVYVETGTLRKAREAAWYLWSQNPRGLEENRLVVRSLARHRDVFSRLSAAERAMKVLGDDAELHRAREEARQFLGIVP